MPNEFTLRWATTADAPALAEAAAHFFADTFGVANRPEDMEAYLAKAFSVERQRDELADASNRVLLALDEQQSVAGYVHLKVGTKPAATTLPTDRQPVEISRLYADRRWHGHGLGALLMRESISAAKAGGADVVWLGVWESNARAIAFYQKHGFRVVGEQAFLLGVDRQRDYVMALSLTTEA